MPKRGVEALQREFTAYLRDPARAAAPAGLPQARLEVYRELVFNNIATSLSSCFPVLKSLLSPATWDALLNDFFARHTCHTPIYRRLPSEFLRYLEEERHAAPGGPAFLYELAHYEWVELALTLDENEIDWAGIDPHGDLMSGLPVLSPLAWQLTYRFPVHRLGPAYQPDTPPPQPTHLIVYRDRDDRIGFLEINLLTYRLLTLLAQDDLTPAQAVGRLAAEWSSIDPVVLHEGAEQTLKDLRARDVILGTLRTRPA